MQPLPESRLEPAPGSDSSADAEPPLPSDPARVALFLDMDGTLAGLREKPEQVSVPPPTIALLGELQQVLRGAVTILSGRPGAGIDELLKPLELAYGANHGAECRDHDGALRRIDAPPALAAVQEALRAAAAAWDGVLVEPKPLGVAVHYRLAPQYRQQVERAVREAAAAHPGQFDVQPGKMVYELRPHGVDKGGALRAFMQAEPCAGRLPIMAGDDLTDESAFEAARACGGFGIKIGPGPSGTPWRLADPPALARWLARLCAAARIHGRVVQ